MSATRDSSRREWLVITVVTLVGAVLRFWNFGRLSLSHFDEGIYAFSGLWIVAKHGLYDLDPSISAYAPPGFPLLVGLSYSLFGVSDYAAILVATVSGIATIPVAGWLGRRTFGPGAGAAAATFAALAMAHVAFSRKALTDAPFLLAWLVAIGVGGRFLERPGFLRALALGVAVGVAQNFKYNGWLTGIIVGLAALAGSLVTPEDRRPGPLLRTFGWGLFAAAAAALLYAPWYLFVETHGGYAALLRHHRSYLNPPAWFGYLRTQLGEAHALSGPGYTGGLTGLMAWFALEVATGPRLPERPWSLRGALAWGVSMGLLLLAFSFQAYYPWWLGLGLAPWLLTRERPAVRLLGVWWMLMTVVTPFYHPYARLWLPLHAAGWLLMAGVLRMLRPAGAVSQVDNLLSSVEVPRRRQRQMLTGVALACGVSAAIHVNLTRPNSIAWSWVLQVPEPSLRRFAYETVPRIIPRKGTTLCLYAPRPLAFYLAQLGAYSIQLEPSAKRLAQSGGPPGSWALTEQSMMGYLDAVNSSWTLFNRKHHSSCIFILDPVTLLDSNPEAAFLEHHPHAGLIQVWAPLIPDLNPAADSGPTVTGPAHDP